MPLVPMAIGMRHSLIRCKKKQSKYTKLTHLTGVYQCEWQRHDESSFVVNLLITIEINHVACACVHWLQHWYPSVRFIWIVQSGCFVGLLLWGVAGLTVAPKSEKYLDKHLRFGANLGATSPDGDRDETLTITNTKINLNTPISHTSQGYTSANGNAMTNHHS